MKTNSSEDYLFLIGSLLFLITSIIIFYLELDNTLLIVPNCIYIVFSTIVFYLQIKKEGFFYPTSWLVFGSMFYFGLGVISGYFFPHAYSEYIFTEFNYIQIISKINIINSIFIFIIALNLLVFSLYFKRNILFNFKNSKIKLIKLYPIFIYLSLFIILSKFYFFPIAENLVIRSILTKGNYFLIFIIFIYGIIKKDLSLYNKIIFYIIFFITLFYAQLNFSKFDFGILIFSYLCGDIFYNQSIKKIFKVLIMCFIVFFIQHHIVSKSRIIIHEEEKNTLIERTEVLKKISIKGANKVFNEMKYISTISSNTLLNQLNNLLKLFNYQIKLNILTNNEIKEKFNLNYTSIDIFDERSNIRGIFLRFNSVFTPTYLIKKYDNNQNGNSFKHLKYVLIPRIIYKDKPIISNFGSDLNFEIFNQEGSIAPISPIEAYWNGGYKLVFIFSFYFSLILIFCNTQYKKLREDNNLEFLIILIPVIYLFSNLESWIVTSYIGDFVTYILMFLLFKFGIFAIFKLKIIKL